MNKIEKFNTETESITNIQMEILNPKNPSEIKKKQKISVWAYKQIRKTMKDDEFEDRSIEIIQYE